MTEQKPHLLKNGHPAHVFTDEDRRKAAAVQEAILGELRRLLHGTPARVVALYLAERLGCDKSGRFTIELRVEEGGLRRAWVRRGPIGAEELEQLGAT